MPRTRPVRACYLLLVLVAVAACSRHPAPATQPPPLAGRPVEPIARPALLIPVAGVHPYQLRDSYHAPRSGGRKHWAIDIPASRGTPVVAAADGTILRLQRGSIGGIALYQLDRDGRTRYYYAHLDRYARGVAEGKRVHQGEVIGYVGDTGNAGRGNYHLHFSIAVLDDVRRWWEGTNINPYPLLTAGLSSR